MVIQALQWLTQLFTYFTHSKISLNLTFMLSGPFKSFLVLVRLKRNFTIPVVSLVNKLVILLIMMSVTALFR